jgi:hypothetical protein
MRTATPRAGWTASVATAAGIACRWAAVGLRSLPGAAGALLIAYGAWQAYHPAGAIVAGIALLAADRRIP